ncbi:hypothetical protein L1887_54069 [Cichorium endivia]|nr:hypothetical protein L1887_54069 [Cichorium endivia]
MTYASQPKDGREAAQRLRDTLKSGKPIIGSGAGRLDHVSAVNASVDRGAFADGSCSDSLYNSGRYRMAGRGSLAGLMPYGDANAIVVEMAAEVLPVIEHTPVLAGVCASDPFRSIPNFLRQLKEIGFVGVQNFPTVGLIDGNFRQNLEETGMGYDKEVELMREAKQLGLLTTPYVFNTREAEQMASVGVDVCVAHMGLTTSGSIGAKTAMTLDDAVKLTAESKLLPSHFGMSADRELQLTLSREPLDSHRQSAFHLSRHHGPRTWRARCQRPRRPIRARPCAWPRRLLRCIQHGASSVETALEESMQGFKNLKVASK